MSMSPSNPQIVVLGGGLTGLSAAFHVARRHPHARITLFEKKGRFGGWVRSERVEVHDEDGNKASVVLEAGARTIRANAKPVLELVNLLKLGPQVLTTPRSAPAARSRFLHIPGAPGLSPLPSSLLSVLTTPLGRLILSSALPEAVWPHNRPADVSDESVDAFLSRRFGAEFARTLGSALVHGIYGAASTALSVRAAFPSLWASEERGRGSVVWGEIGPPAWFGASQRKEEAQKADEAEAWEFSSGTALDGKLADASIISFKDGVQTLIDGLVHALEGSENVSLRSSTEVSAVKQTEDFQTFEISLADGTSLSATHIISALPLPALSAILPPNKPLPHLLTNPFSTVTVMNLVFPTARLTAPLHPPGFGYLIPRPEGGYPDTPGAVGMLGVVFDTASLADQDYALGAESGNSDKPYPATDQPKFVKLTAMLGGPYPTQTPPPSDEALLASVLPQVAAQLQTELPTPSFYRVHRNAQSIPTYLVGHVERMADLRAVLKEQWGGRLMVIGAGVGGVSVSDCVRAGREAAREVASGGDKEI
ncbi:Protoporphyrinogen oxidase [Auriscalpium vulgare]|uniref:Protoporphyrinogen oxidase n=1 Tax=Auriscalpium vulgare TaxID=40419 RepID=A0ACB8RM64_9AGAM|nr:Protoporphyrinogen oxidase [Auriscalpium vulgare]